MAAGHQFHNRRNSQNPSHTSPLSNPLDRPIISPKPKPPPEILLCGAGVPHGKIPNQDHVLLRRNQRPRFAPTGVRPDRGRHVLGGGEHHGGLR